MKKYINDHFTFHMRNCGKLRAFGIIINPYSDYIEIEFYICYYKLSISWWKEVF